MRNFKYIKVLIIGGLACGQVRDFLPYIRTK